MPLQDADADKPPPRQKVSRRPVHGVLLLDKPLELSSNQALQKAKWLLRAEKAGHTGTLDPLASGLLPLCFGAATKFSQLQLDADKIYETTVRLGQRTTTADAEGQVVQERPVHCTRADIEAAAARFVGTIEQLPPMHSALKKDGKALYEYARAGQIVERTPRRVHIHRIDVLDVQLQSPTPSVRLRVACSKGTYIRTLGEDLGEALGCGAHLTSLRRIATGSLHIGDAITLQELEALDENARLALLRHSDILLRPTHTKIVLGPADAARFLSGLRRRGTWPDAEHVAVWGSQPKALLGIGHVCAGELIAQRLLTPVEIEQTLAQRAQRLQLASKPTNDPSGV